jgi:hypothetical protein
MSGLPSKPLYSQSQKTLSSFVSHAYTLTLLEAAYQYFSIVSQSGITGAATLTIPSGRVIGLFVVNNTCGYNVTVRYASGTTVVPNGVVMLLQGDGTNVHAITVTASTLETTNAGTDSTQYLFGLIQAAAVPSTPNQPLMYSTSISFNQGGSSGSHPAITIGPTSAAGAAATASLILSGGTNSNAGAGIFFQTSAPTNVGAIGTYNYVMGGSTLTDLAIKAPSKDIYFFTGTLAPTPTLRLYANGTASFPSGVVTFAATISGSINGNAATATNLSNPFLGVSTVTNHITPIAHGVPTPISLSMGATNGYAGVFLLVATNTSNSGSQTQTTVFDVVCSAGTLSASAPASNFSGTQITAGSISGDNSTISLSSLNFVTHDGSATISFMGIVY